MRIPSSHLKRQCEAILNAWGMTEEHARITSERLQYADLHGVDSHGMALLPLYERLRAEGRLNFAAQVRVVRSNAVTALIDADGGLGHPAGTSAMLLAIEKAKQGGVGAIAVRRSNHFGAAGAYAVLAAEAGLVGLAFSSAWEPAIVPTYGTQSRFGTNPLAIAARGSDGTQFCFDIATSTVAIGKLRLAELHDRPIEAGWALDDHGQITTDARIALDSRRLTPLGGTPVLSSHKGYGLAATVELLSTMLSGAWYCATRDERHPGETQFNIGHFFIAIDPKAFRLPGEFEADLTDMLQALRATPPAEAGQPVLAPGDREAHAYTERSVHGVELPANLLDQVRRIAQSCGAQWILAAQ
jgi:LDH2 family malate/lactate/ureidoglycolate dehydrogenase